MFPQRLKARRKETGLTLEQLAEKYNRLFDGGLTKGTLSFYENGKQNPLGQTISNLAEVLGVSTDYLLGKTDYRTQEEEFAAWDEKLNPDGKLAKEVAVFERVFTKLRMYERPVSAGTGEWLQDGTEYHFELFENAPAESDFALKVRGDSMEPWYSDGDVVFVKVNTHVESGQIGVFVLNENGYLKMLQGSKLVSTNPKYKPITIGEFDSFFVVGRVIGKAGIKE